MTLEQVSGNAFEGPADTGLAGAYALHIVLTDRQGNELLAADSGAVVSWTREFDLRSTEDGKLTALSEATGGHPADTPEGLMGQL